MEFEKALKQTLKYEGGFVNDSADPGGATNLGISFRFLKSIDPSLADINNDGDVDVRDIEDMTIEDASPIYKKCFWDTCHCDEIPGNLAFVIFDTAVNMGNGGAGKMIQLVLTYLNYDITVDSSIGPKTVKAINDACKQKEESEVIKRCLLYKINFYKKLAEKRPQMKKFLKGWINRVNDTAKFLKIDL